ncbi:hypothetical protein ACOCG7_23480 [Paraburkholderia sp. DD10]
MNRRVLIEQTRLSRRRGAVQHGTSGVTASEMLRQRHDRPYGHVT